MYSTGFKTRHNNKILPAKLLTLFAGLVMLLILPSCVTEFLAIWTVYSERSISLDRDNLKSLGRVAVICYSPTMLKIKQEVSSIVGTTLEETDFIKEKGWKVDVGGQFRKLIGQETFARLLRKKLYEKLKKPGTIELVPDHTMQHYEMSLIKMQTQKETYNPADQFKSDAEKQELRPDYKIMSELVKTDSVLELRVEAAFIKPLQLSVIAPNYKFTINIKGSLFRAADKEVFWREEFHNEDRVTQMSGNYIYENLVAEDGAMLREIIDRNSEDMARQIYEDINIEGK